MILFLIKLKYNIHTRTLRMIRKFNHSNYRKSQYIKKKKIIKYNKKMKIVIFNVIIKHVIKNIDFDNFIVEYNDIHIP